MSSEIDMQKLYAMRSRQVEVLSGWHANALSELCKVAAERDATKIKAEYFARIADERHEALQTAWAEIERLRQEESYFQGLTRKLLADIQELKQERAARDA